MRWCPCRSPCRPSSPACPRGKDWSARKTIPRCTPCTRRCCKPSRCRRPCRWLRCHCRYTPPARCCTRFARPDRVPRRRHRLRQPYKPRKRPGGRPCRCHTSSPRREAWSRPCTRGFLPRRTECPGDRRWQGHSSRQRCRPRTGRLRTPGPIRRASRRRRCPTPHTRTRQSHSLSGRACMPGRDHTAGLLRRPAPRPAGLRPDHCHCLEVLAGRPLIRRRLRKVSRCSRCHCPWVFRSSNRLWWLGRTGTRLDRDAAQARISASHSAGRENYSRAPSSQQELATRTGRTVESFARAPHDTEEQTRINYHNVGAAPSVEVFSRATVTIGVYISIARSKTQQLS